MKVLLSGATTRSLRKRHAVSFTTMPFRSKAMVSRTPEDTERAGADLALRLGPNAGDFVMLFGQVGAGKSVFARGFIREVTGRPDLKVQSPTYLLEQEYACDDLKLLIHHFDLYRFNPEMTEVDAKALDWRSCLQQGVSLVEWPERIKNKDLLPNRWIEVRIEISPDAEEEQRLITMEEKIKSTQ